MPRKRRIEDDLRRDLSDRERKVLLKRAGLPSDYPDLAPRFQRQARKASLTSWFDPEKPHVLCIDVEKFVKALFLYTEFYKKPAPMNLGVYFFEDHRLKYDMVRLVMSPSKIEGMPSKSLLMATRRTGKTQTIVIDMIEMMVLVRPFTPCLITEYSDKRTSQEIKKIKKQFEGNEIIHRDFGGQGELYPRSNASETWTAHELELIHHPGCVILGHSLGSAVRGIGPLFGGIDDPEPDDMTYNREWRISFMNILLRTYVKMFHWGGHIVWIGTPQHEASCLALAARGLSEDGETDEATTDSRLLDWKRGKFTLIVRKEDGDFESMQPQRMSVKTFHEEMKLDPVGAMREILCEPAPSGIRAFNFDPVKHGFMHCLADDGSEYMLDLLTGEEMPWRDFLAQLSVAGAGDLADGQSKEADPGALGFVGVDPNGTLFVLDAYNKICKYEDLADMSFVISEEWECGKFFWERAALQHVLNRQTKEKADELRREGKAPPSVREICNAKKNKVRRILALGVLFRDRNIRFRHLDPIKDPSGRVHRPASYPREGMYRTLLHQVTMYTDEGIQGHDDVIDAVEIAIRGIARDRGDVLEKKPENKTDEMVERWRKVGVELGPEQIPMEAWSPKIHAEIERRLMAPVYSVMDDVPYM